MATEQTGKPLSHSDYAVGWVCALSKEQTAATAMLDVVHDNLPTPEGDHNAYTLGSIGKHNIVIACLPEGVYGTNAAATVVSRMLSTFPSIRFGLMVGIGGGIPDRDVRLGDVVVSVPQDAFPGVVQWDMGRASQEGFQRTGALNHPPNILLSAVSKLRTEHDLNGPRIQMYLDQMKEKYPRLASKYMRSDALKDILFASDYAHEPKHSVYSQNDHSHSDNRYSAGMNRESILNNDCYLCDSTKVVNREPREQMEVHYGLIASGNQVIKNAVERDRINATLGGGVLCFEMEAAGLMNNFPCLVIRGICDYADSHKNKKWQEHAAAVAAAYAKELLQEVQPAAVGRERAALEVINEGRS